MNDKNIEKLRAASGCCANCPYASLQEIEDEGVSYWGCSMAYCYAEDSEENV